jgi:hypothetical protein
LPLQRQTRAGVANREINLIRRSPQSHFEVPYPTVFCRIVEGILQDSEEAKRNVRRQRAGQVVVFEFNLHLLLLGERGRSGRKNGGLITPIGKMIFTVLGAVAELERSLIAERVAAMARAGAPQAREP